MKIEVTQLPETKVSTLAYKSYITTYPEGYPVIVRVISKCEDCNIEIGGFFGNRVYRFEGTKKCQACGAKNSECFAQTGMTNTDYQQRHGRAWNE